MSRIVPREAKKLLRTAFENTACVLLLGPRQVGKTTLAREFATEYWHDWDPSEDYKDLEQPEGRLKLQAIDAFVTDRVRKIIVLDEAQCMPEIFPKLRSLLDTNPISGHKEVRWLILGSATSDLEALTNKNLSGRHRKIRLTPFQLPELYPSHKQPTTTAISNISVSPDPVLPSNSPEELYNLTQKLWLKGGFPRSYLENNTHASLEWRNQYIDSILGPQSPAQSSVIRPEKLKLLWEKLASEQGKCNIQQLPGKLGCSMDNLNQLLHALESGNLIRQVRRWHTNPSKRLDKSPLWFIRDSGLLHSQLNIYNMDSLQQSDIKGKSWEGFVLESILASAPPMTKVFYFRKDERYEADIILEMEGNHRWIIEVKFGDSQSVSQGFFKACEELHPERQFIIHGGQSSFRSNSDIDFFCLYDALSEMSIHREAL